GAIVNADISGTAAIAGTKVAPSFGAQNISTTGTLNTGAITTTNLASINAVTYTWPNAQGASGTVLTNGGTGTLTWVPGSTGTVTSVTAGNGLTGGPITATGALSVDVGTTANKIVQLDGTGRLPAVDGSQLTNLPVGSAWNLSGNTGSTPGTDFIGTTDAQDLVFKTNNTERLRVTQNGFLGIGTLTPGVKLEIFGSGTGFRHTDGTITVESQVGGTEAYFGTTTANHNFHLLAGGVDQMIIRADNGSVGFGRNPTNQKLEVGGGVYIDGNLGLGTPTPAARLDVAGTVKIVDGTEAAGRVLTSDASGLASWQPAGAGSGWTLVGNGGTVDGTNFIGTTDLRPINFRVNNDKAGRISTNDTGGIFYGWKAGEGQIEGSAIYNTGIGTKALWLNATGSQNTAIGQGALLANTGSNNSALGQGALSQNLAGNNNTGIGALALLNNTTGSGNTAIGEAADVTGSAFTNATAIGFNAKVGASSALVLGGTGLYAVNVGIGTTIPNYTLDVRGTIGSNVTLYHSDLRWKNNISTYENALGKILQIRGVKYNWRTSEFKNMGFDEGIQIGFIAQEIEKVFPELVDTGADGYKSVKYANFTALLVEAVKDQQNQIEKLKSDLGRVTKEKEVLESKVTSFELQQESIQKDVEELKKILGMKASTN
ncbi:MAG: tail fiber domain-containing protein, partial [Cyclobacteriaceae bacterium]|nr:tail fiber domain-containing protein [Cyclobacteriaceae bacterium]